MSDNQADLIHVRIDKQAGTRAVSAFFESQYAAQRCYLYFFGIRTDIRKDLLPNRILLSRNSTRHTQCRQASAPNLFIRTVGSHASAAVNFLNIRFLIRQIRKRRPTGIAYIGSHQACCIFHIIQINHFSRGVHGTFRNTEQCGLYSTACSGNLIRIRSG